MAGNLSCSENGTVRQCFSDFSTCRCQKQGRKARKRDRQTEKGAFLCRTVMPYMWNRLPRHGRPDRLSPPSYPVSQLHRYFKKSGTTMTSHSFLLHLVSDRAMLSIAHEQMQANT